jgi:DNA-binding PadR family transcriptional regulator
VYGFEDMVKKVTIQFFLDNQLNHKSEEKISADLYTFFANMEFPRSLKLEKVSISENQITTLQNAHLSETSIARRAKKIEEQIVKKHIDIIILKAINCESLSGYGIISLIRKKFNVWISPGTIYPLLYTLEQKRIISSYSSRGARFYYLSEKGKETIRLIAATQDKIKALVDKIFFQKIE